MRSLIKIIITLLIGIAGIEHLGAQASTFHEYLVSINPADGSFTTINSIPGVSLIQTGPSGTTIDKVGNRFFFTGIDTASQLRLYTLDVTNGNLIYNPPIQLINSTDNFGQFKFDDSLKTLFGVYWNSAEQEEYFISVNDSTGAFTFINSISGVQSIAIGVYSYDQRDHIYFFQGDNGLYSINALNGSVIHNPAVNGNLFNAIRYDNSTNNLYGNLLGTLLKVDPVTADTTIVGAVPSIVSVVGFPNATTFDEVHQRFTVQGSDNSSSRLYSLDTLNANVISDPLFPAGLDSGENLIELNYDNGNGTLYALHWGHSRSTGINSIVSESSVYYYPNPFTNTITFYLPQAYHSSAINIYSSDGRLARCEERTDSKETIVNRGSLNAGDYIFEVIAEGRRISEGKIVSK